MASTKTKKYTLNGQTIIDYMYSNGVLYQRFFYNNSGKIVEKDFFTNGVLKNKQYFDSNSKLTKQVMYNSSGKIYEIDFYNTNGKITEKDYYTNGVLKNKSFYTNSKLSIKEFYNNAGYIYQKDVYSASAKITEQDYFTNGVLTSKVFYNTSSKVTEKDFYSNGVLNYIYYYNTSTNKVTQKDVYTQSGLVAERDYYTNGVLTSKAYFDANGVITEKELYKNSKLYQINYYDSNGKYVSTGVINTNSFGEKVITFGQSNSWASYLDYAQGDNSKGYLLCCGLVSCENVLIEMGKLSKKSSYSPAWSKVDSLESQIVNYAAANGLCSTGSTPNNNGLTYGIWQQKILAHFGVIADDVYVTADDIANAVKNNKCVIAEVDAYTLWGTGRSELANHAITVTGVVYDFNNPNEVDGFYICDSGRWLKSDANRYISYDLFEDIFELNSNDTIGEAVITNGTGKQVLGSVAAASYIASDYDVSNIIQQMSAYAVSSGLSRDSVMTNDQYNALTELVPVTA